MNYTCSYVVMKTKIAHKCEGKNGVQDFIEISGILRFHRDFKDLTNKQYLRMHTQPHYAFCTGVLAILKFKRMRIIVKMDILK